MPSIASRRTATKGSKLGKTKFDGNRIKLRQRADLVQFDGEW